MTTAAPLANDPDRLADRELHNLVERFVRRRVPDSEVEDLVQTVLCAAVGAPRIPDGREDLRRWLIGIARHKIADLHRVAGRERPTERPQITVEPAPFEARNMVGWAEREAASAFQAEQTLGWMALEGEGETLATIASAEQLPAPRVRKRVSRLRNSLRRRWLAELAVVAGLAVAGLLLWQLRDADEVMTAKPSMPTIAADPAVDEARALRAEALVACEQERWRACLLGLDRARGLDPAGDLEAAVGVARQRAADALAEPTPSAEPKTEPTAARSAPTATPSLPSTAAKKPARHHKGSKLSGP